VECGGVAGFVLLDLELQEFVDGGKGIGIGGGDDDAAAVGSVDEGIFDGGAEALHFGNAGRNGIVNEHGDIEIAVCEGLRDVGEVHADVVAVRGVGCVVGFDLNYAAIRFQEEMVRGGGLRKAHAFFAALFHGHRRRGGLHVRVVHRAIGHAGVWLFVLLS